MNAAFRSSAPISFAMPPYPKGFKLRREKQRRCNEPDRLAGRERMLWGIPGRGMVASVISGSSGRWRAASSSAAESAKKTSCRGSIDLF
jgi:hypothetical protein